MLFLLSHKNREMVDAFFVPKAQFFLKKKAAKFFIAQHTFVVCSLRFSFFLVFNFLWETRKKMKFLARKIREISQHNLLVLLHFYVTIFGHFFEIQEMALPGGWILTKFLNLLNFYVTIFSEILNLKKNFLFTNK